MPHNHNENVMLKNSEHKSSVGDEESLEPSIANPNKKGSQCNKIHLAITLCLLVICVAMIVFYVIEMRSTKKTDEKQSSHEQVCNTPECIKLAGQVLTYMDPKVDPCKDFYKYACGGWLKKNFIPDNKFSWDIFSELAEANDKVLKNKLEEGTPEKNDTAAEKLYQLYKSCKNESRIASIGTKPLLDVIKDFGSWSVTDPTWNSSAWNMMENLVKIHSFLPASVYGPANAPLFDIHVRVDNMNSSRHIIEITQPSFGMMSRDLYGGQSPAKDAYLAAMKKIARLLGGTNNVDKLMEDVLDFETSLINVTLSPEKLRNIRKTYKSMTIKELMKETNNKFDWLTYLKGATKPAGISLDENTIISTKPLSYLKQMVEINSKANTETVANYFIWTVVRGLVKLLSKPFIQAYFEFEKTMYGVEVQDPRWQQCIRMLGQTMGMAVGAIFVKEKFKSETKDEVEKMIQDIKNTFMENLEQLEWMDEPTRKLAERKAKATIDNIAYPKFIKDPAKLAKLYEGVSLQSGQFFDNVWKLRRHNKIQNLKKYLKKVDREEWGLSPYIVNAFYDAGRNKMAFFRYRGHCEVFLAGILQPPFYRWKGPKSMNYGGIGMVMGHELTHGFDDQGRLYNYRGDMKDWWTPKSAQRFLKRATCISKQYSAYSLHGAHTSRTMDQTMRRNSLTMWLDPYGIVNSSLLFKGTDQLNGNLTLGENIADNGGLKTAYKAYKKWLQKNGPEKKLPGMNMTDEQLFFLASAQIWCSLDRKEYILAHLPVGKHSPGIFRVFGTVSNSKDFSRAFNCPANSTMNPQNKCIVW